MRRYWSKGTNINHKMDKFQGSGTKREVLLQYCITFLKVIIAVELQFCHKKTTATKL